MSVATKDLSDSSTVARSSPVRLRQFFDALLLAEFVIVIPSAVVLLVVVGEPWAVVPLVAVSLFTIGIGVARRFVERGRPSRAVAVVTMVYVPTALLTALAGLYALPMLAVSAVIPPTLAVPYLRRRSTARLLIGTVSLSAVVTLIAVTAAGSAWQDDIPDSFRTVNVILGAPLACALVMLLARQNHLSLHEQAIHVREARRRTVATADTERRRAERDLHDGAQQRLHSAIVQVALARRLLASDSGAAIGVLEQTSSEIAATIEELARLARGFLPPTLVANGLDGALAELTARSSLPIEVTSAPVGRLPIDVEAAIWFCCSEAVQNANKHAGPDASVSIAVERVAGEVRFSVVDDGSGSVAPSTGGQGIANMTTRVEALGGHLTVDSSCHGTVVAGVVPVSDGWQHA